MILPMSVMTTSDTNKAKTDSAEPNEKPDKISLVELKNGKLNFKQKSLSFEKMSETMQEIVKFRELIEERMERKALSLSAVPDEHRPLIAKLVHESDKTLQALSKHVHKELLPTQDEDDDGANAASSALEVEAVEKAIKFVANRNDYGLDSVGEAKVPAALHIWRWEVKDEFKDWLPKAAKEKAEARWAERRQVKKDLKALFESIPLDERSAILGPKGTAKAPLKAKSSKKTAGDKSTAETADAERKSSPHQSKKQSKDIQENVNGEDIAPDEGTVKGPGRPKKPVDPEKAAKEKEKQEKKAAKAEKEKKEKEAREKSRSIMANFFGKPKVPAMRRSASITNDGACVAGPSSVRSDFEKSFKPFAVKKDAVLAPINWFQSVKTHKYTEHRERGVEVIVLDAEDEVKQEPPGDVQMLEAQDDVHLGQQTVKERLRNSLASLPPAFHLRHRRHLPASHMKSYSRHSVRSIMAQLNEAEITGDDAQVRALLALLRNRTLLPAKVLVFDEDARPGYFGTWTRSSRAIGPRAPFARDLLALDYACDSGAEWEDESGDADDVVEDAEDEDGDADSDDSADSWLVDDDGDPGTPLEERACSPVLPLDIPLPASAPKRKADADAAKGGKKRKVVVPLVPFTKGPCWEARIGRCEYELFKAYRIERFNDTPYPIDPFTFVSARVDESMPPAADSTRFVVPALPAHLTPAAASDAPARKRTALPPKTTFPEAHVPLLLLTIVNLATGNLTYIVETVHRELQAERVKKNAIEAKVRELGEKCRERKIWVVRPGVRT